jgi:cytochrome P450
MTQNESIFENARNFNPRRFLRSDENQSSQHPFAAIPFGHGARKCAGAGFAQLDVHLATICLVKKFKFSYSGAPLDIVEQSLLRPTREMTSDFCIAPR